MFVCWPDDIKHIIWIVKTVVWGRECSHRIPSKLPYAENCCSKVSYIFDRMCRCSNGTCAPCLLVQGCSFICCLSFSHSVSRQEQLCPGRDVSTDTQTHTRTLVLSAGTLHHHVLQFSALHLAGKTGRGGSHAHMKCEFGVLRSLRSLTSLRVHYLSHMRCRLSLFAAICISSYEREKNDQKGRRRLPIRLEMSVAQELTTVFVCVGQEC